MTSTANPNFVEIKARQKAMWASGDYAVVGTTLQMVGEALVEAADVHAGQSVLDVACGNGNCSLAAGRRYAEVTGLDYVPSLLARAEMRAQADGMRMKFVEGDAEAMPFHDSSFDVVLSSFGVMFAPDHAQAAREMTRVAVPGGKIALASWTPDGFIGQLLRCVGKFVPPPPGVSSPILWGTEQHLANLFGDRARVISAQRKHYTFCYLSTDHFIDMFRRYYGPTHKAFGVLDARGQSELDAEMRTVIERHRRNDTLALAVPSEYLEVALRTEG